MKKEQVKSNAAKFVRESTTAKHGNTAEQKRTEARELLKLLQRVSSSERDFKMERESYERSIWTSNLYATGPGGQEESDMPTNRKRLTRNRIADVSEAAWKVMLDREPPPDANEFEVLELRYPTVRFKESKALWEMCAAEILAVYIATDPGRRPSWWWHFSAPRCSDADLIAWGYDENWYRWRDQRPCEPRLRLGGVGDPAFLHLAYAPEFVCGIPASWVTPYNVALYNGRARDIHGKKIMDYEEGDFAGVAPDPQDPPRFESQASYVKRHNLFLPGESRRLKPADFADEILQIEEPYIFAV